jgi:hypothetical protein
MHDLPRFWDDLAVVWDGWHAPLSPVFVCPPPPPSCCVACGSMAEPVVNRGRVARASFITHEQIDKREESRDRLPVSLKHHPRRNALYRLFAHRCPDCKHDEVWDMDTDEWWKLDAGDYADEGSRASA